MLLMHYAPVRRACLLSSCRVSSHPAMGANISPARKLAMELLGSSKCLASE